MRYQDIRNAFPQCAVAVTDYGIMLILPQYVPAREISQSINNREFHNQEILIRLLESCDTFQIRLHPGVGAYVLFEMPMPIDHQMIWNPVKPAPSLKELDDLVYRSIVEHNGGSVLVDTLNGVDLDDPMEIIRAIYHDTDDRCVIHTIDDIRAWASLQKIASDLNDEWGQGDYLEEPPDDDLEFGTISWSFETKSTAPIQVNMDHEQTKLFTELCRTADVISLSGIVRVNSAELALEFYS